MRAPAKIGKAALLRLVALAHPPSEQGQRQPGLGAWRIFSAGTKTSGKAEIIPESSSFGEMEINPKSSSFGRISNFGQGKKV